MVSEEFKKNVELGDVVTIRSALIDYLIIDTTFRRFDEALEYAKQFIDVIEPDDGKADDGLAQEHWDETYLNKQKVALMVNFSQKRIDHIKLVVKTVLADKAHGVQNPDAVKEPPKVKTQGNRTGRTVLSEEAIPRPEQSAKASMDVNVKAPKTVSKSDSKANYSAQQTSKPLGGGRTGRTTIGEKSSSVKRTEEEVHRVDIAAWMIGAGITAAAVGGLTAGIGAIAAKPAVIHAGVAIAGVGGAATVSGGVIKIVKEK
ncbi:MAG: hypothetical protein HFH42_11570 [Lachnospiraceae bacterium]|nr:hypothetical protein [Lachnospiraceae bacterium]